MLRVFNHYVSTKKAVFFFTETWSIGIACFLGAGILARLMAPTTEHLTLKATVPLFALVSLSFVASLQFALYLFDLYDLRIAQEDRARGLRILKAVGAAAVLVGVTVTLLHLRLPTGTLLGGALGAFAGTVAVRMSLRSVVGHANRVLLIGNGVKSLSVLKAIEEGGEDAYQIVARIEPPRAGVERHLSEPLDETARNLRAEYVVMAVDEPRGAIWVEELVRCRFQGMRVYDAAGFSERVLRRVPVAHVKASEFAFCDDVHASRVRESFKRAFDLLMAAALLVCATPAVLVVAVLIKLDSEGPVLYSQERVGRAGKSYRLWKFRSMRTDAEKNGAVWARSNDDRVTRMGRFIRKTRIDEIPQVFNVLLGDMSFVGPRPERPVFVEQLKRQIPFYSLREGVKPGITGWAQIRYPYGASVEDARNKLEFDLYYVKNGSLFLDLGIIFHTVRHVLFGRGAR